MSMTTANMEVLIRSEIWSNELKEVLLDELLGLNIVRFLTDFPDGTTITIPSIGEASVRDYVENTPIVYDAIDTGEFQFSITEYKSSGNYITKKARQDAFYAAQLEAGFVPKQKRAILENLETNIMALAAGGASGGQTAAAANAINGANHRWVASGTSEVMDVTDFMKAKFALKKANVGDQNLIAIVDPSVEYALSTLANLVSVSNNPRWEGIIETGLASGMKFIRNIYGFDVYVSNYLADAGAAQTGAETIGAKSVTVGKCNMFFSAQSDILPFVGAWRQMPEVEGEYNKDFQREEYLTTCRYGLKVFRPENLVVVLSDTDQVSF
jgi:hypothetical protein